MPNAITSSLYPIEVTLIEKQCETIIVRNTIKMREAKEAFDKRHKEWKEKKVKWWQRRGKEPYWVLPSNDFRWIPKSGPEFSDWARASIRVDHANEFLEHCKSVKLSGGNICYLDRDDMLTLGL